MLAAIVAMGENRVIGLDGGLPWRLPDELKHFKKTTLGRVCLMGRKTYETLNGPLPGRVNLVLTRSRRWQAKGVEVARSLDDALALAAELAEPGANTDPDRCPIVLGGAGLYRWTLPRLGRLELTVVHARPAGDTWFPPLDEDEWVERRREKHPPDERHRYGFTVRSLDRRVEFASESPK